MVRPRVLFLAANPANTTLLALDDEVAQIDAVVGPRSFDWNTERAVRRAELRRLLAQHRPMILHFSGHGVTDGLMLLDDEGDAALLSGAALRRTCEAAGAVTRLAVLNACHTDEHAAELANHVDCVIGTTGRISDDAAREFSRVLYRELGAGRSVKHAFDTARDALRDSNAGGRGRDLAAAEPSRSIAAADLLTLHARPGVEAAHVILASRQSQPSQAPAGLEPAETLYGRERDLGVVQDKLHGPRGIIALWGMAGVGKTALARACAWQQVEEGHAVLWITRAALSGGQLASIGEALASGATVYLDDVEQGPVLAAVEELASRGRVVITTRDELLAAAHIAVPIAPLSNRDAVCLLLERTGEKDAESAARIAELASGSPAMLVQVAGLVAATSETLQTLCTQLLSTSAHQLDTAVFDLIYDRLADQPATQGLLQLLGVFGLDRIGRAELPAFVAAVLGTSASDERVLLDSLAALRRHSLIVVTPEAVSIPRVVQQMVVRRVTPTERAALFRAGLEFSWSLVESRDVVHPAELKDLASRVMLAIDPAAIAVAGRPTHANTAQMFAAASHRLGLFNEQERQDPQRALQLFRQSAAQQQAGGAINGQRAYNQVLRHMAWTAARTGDPDWLSACERAIEVARRYLSPEEVASTLNDAGATAHAAGDHERALAFFRDVVEHATEEERQTLHHASTLDNLGKLEHSLSHQADGIRARELHEAAIRHTWQAMDLRIKSKDEAEKALGAYNLADVLTCARVTDRDRTRAALGLVRCARGVWKTTRPAWSDELAAATAEIVELSNALGDVPSELDEVKRLLEARCAHAKARLTPRTFRLAKIVRDTAGRSGAWDDVARAVFLMLEVHPELPGREDEKRDNVAQQLAWLRIAAEHGAVEDSEYASHATGYPESSIDAHEAEIREELGLPERKP